MSSSSSSVAWGCTAAVVLSAIQSLGITLQRKSHVIPYNHELANDTIITLRRDSAVTLDMESSRHPHHYKRSLWLTGFLLFIVANVFGSLVQLTTLPLIILSPLQSIGLIFNSIMSCMLLPGELFTKKLFSGTIIIAVGAFIIAYNGAGGVEPPTDIGTDERFRLMMQKFTRPGFLTWWIFTFVYVGVLVKINMVLANKINHQNKVLLRKVRRNSQDRVSKYYFTRGILYGIISGTLTAHTFLFAKSIVDVLVETVMQRGTPKSLATYVTTTLLLLATLAIVGMQLVAFNLGLANILTSILYPLCFLVYNLVNMINDLLFNQLLNKHLITIKELACVILGLLGVLIGVVTISWDSAFGLEPQEADDTQGLMKAKFPYENGRGRVMSYEEAELVNHVLGYGSN